MAVREKTLEKIALVDNLVKQGHGVTEACDDVGLSPGTYRRYKNGDTKTNKPKRRYKKRTPKEVSSNNPEYTPMVLQYSEPKPVQCLCLVLQSKLLK